jgi:uncharacterized protein (DUF2147 family)
MLRRAGLFALFALAALAALPASAQAPSMLGVWVLDEGRGRISVYRCGVHLCGQLISLRQPLGADRRPRRDEKNPEPVERNNPLLRKTILWNLSPTPDQVGQWENGRFYDFDRGEAYRVTANLQADGTLRVRLAPPVVGVVIARSVIWTRR